MAGGSGAWAAPEQEEGNPFASQDDIDAFSDSIGESSVSLPSKPETTIPEIDIVLADSPACHTQLETIPSEVSAARALNAFVRSHHRMPEARPLGVPTALAVNEALLAGKLSAHLRKHAFLEALTPTARAILRSLPAHEVLDSLAERLDASTRLSGEFTPGLKTEVDRVGRPLRLYQRLGPETQKVWKRTLGIPAK